MGLIVGNMPPNDWALPRGGQEKRRHVAAIRANRFGRIIKNNIGMAADTSNFLRVSKESPAQNHRCQDLHSLLRKVLEHLDASAPPAVHGNYPILDSFKFETPHVVSVFGQLSIAGGQRAVRRN
jgi:hypothetical protein